jgi:predicted RNA-binding Zn-ribbon protein involved in translation (DUF1610 family)
MTKDKDYWRNKKREQRAKAKAAKLDVVSESKLEVVPDVVEFVPKPDLAGMTATDGLFEAEDPGYWIWMRDAVKRECMVCGAGYETRLELNRFCGPECKTEMIVRLSTMRELA